MAPKWCDLCNHLYNTRNMYKKHCQREQHQQRAKAEVLKNEIKSMMKLLGYILLIASVFGFLCWLGSNRAEKNDAASLNNTHLNVTSELEKQVKFGPDLLPQGLPDMMEKQNDFERASDVDPEDKSTPEFEDDSISKPELKTDDESKSTTAIVPELPPPDFEPNSDVIVYLGGKKKPNIRQEF